MAQENFESLVQSALVMIEPQWHELFLQFIQDPNSVQNEVFDQYINTDERAQHALEFIFGLQLEPLEDVLENMRKKHRERSGENPDSAS